MAKDKAGVNYTGPTNKPVTAGTRVVIQRPNGPTKGTMLGGGYVKADKKKS